MYPCNSLRMPRNFKTKKKSQSAGKGLKELFIIKETTHQSRAVHYVFKLYLKFKVHLWHFYFKTVFTN